MRKWIFRRRAWATVIRSVLCGSVKCCLMCVQWVSMDLKKKCYATNILWDILWNIWLGTYVLYYQKLVTFYSGSYCLNTIYYNRQEYYFRVHVYDIWKYWLSNSWISCYGFFTLIPCIYWRSYIVRTVQGENDG